MYPVSHITNGRLKASHGKAIGGGLWLHLEASRRDARELGNDIGRVRSGDNVVLVVLEGDLRLGGDFDRVIAVGLEEGLRLVDESDDVGSVLRVVRFVDFVGDSTGGGKSLGWLRVATIMCDPD
jgi:hypothetical protein